MIVDRYPPVNLFTLLSCDQLRRSDPVLATLDELLDDDELFCRVKTDLVRRHPRSADRGRHSTPVEVILRMLLCRRLYNWSYEETERLVWDSLSLRQFCRVGEHTVPDDTTLIRWAACLRPETMQALHARVVQLAGERTVTRGRTLRVDGTVVETTIHPPSDSALLVDGVRMLSRLLGRAAGVLEQVPTALVRNRTRAARRLGRQIGEALTKGETVRQDGYRRLLGITRATLRQAHTVAQLLSPTDRLRTRMEQLITLTEQVVEQTRRRVLAGEPVPAAEKLVSLVEPHTAILARSRPQQVRYGHRVILGEADGGIITSYQRLPGTEPEAPQLPAAVEQHRRHTGRLPHLVTTDGGFYAPGQTEALEQRGVKQVVIPYPGNRRPERERTRWFRRGRRFRVGIEGRISVCKRNGWLGRCRDHGEAGFDRWIGWGILAANLTIIGRHQALPAGRRAA